MDSDSTDDDRRELCRQLYVYTHSTARALGIDSYAAQVYEANRASGM
jgi:hypothetical protein